MLLWGRCFSVALEKPVYYKTVGPWLDLFIWKYLRSASEGEIIIALIGDATYFSNARSGLICLPIKMNMVMTP